MEQAGMCKAGGCGAGWDVEGKGCEAGWDV